MFCLKPLKWGLVNIKGILCLCNLRVVMADVLFEAPEMGVC
jgi:hypothetical protein